MFCFFFLPLLLLACLLGVDVFVPSDFSLGRPRGFAPFSWENESNSTLGDGRGAAPASSLADKEEISARLKLTLPPPPRAHLSSNPEPEVLVSEEQVFAQDRRARGVNAPDRAKCYLNFLFIIDTRKGRN